jgi:hypothetical protein
MSNSYNNTIAALTIPLRIRALPISENGYPIPWFSGVVNDSGERDLRVADPVKRAQAVRKSLCWVCGQPLGVYKCFVIGPMCVVNRTTSEPPCHQDCARFSAIACPFLTKPRMRRNDTALPEKIQDAPGFAITRNPGVTCIWATKTYKTFSVSEDRRDWLIRIGDPTYVEWFAEGKEATRQQVTESIDSGLPILFDMARQDGADAVSELERRHAEALRYYPREVAA